LLDPGITRPEYLLEIQWPSRIPVLAIRSYSTTRSHYPLYKIDFLSDPSPGIKRLRMKEGEKSKPSSPVSGTVHKH
jgi:hypothetical protein